MINCLYDPLFKRHPVLYLERLKADTSNLECRYILVSTSERRVNSRQEH